MDAIPMRVSAAEELHELLATDLEISDFVNELARVAADEMSKRFPVLCGITLDRQKRAAVAGSSSERARQLDEIQAGFDEGPCLASQAAQTAILVSDVAEETRWPDYMMTVREQGLRSILAVPLDLADTAKAAMNFYATDARAFQKEEVAIAERFAMLISRAMRVALRIARHTEAAEHRRLAMESRTSIDVAVGIIMAQNNCSQDEAFEVLVSVSSNRNIKLGQLAKDVVASIGQPTPTTVFEE